MSPNIYNNGSFLPNIVKAVDNVIQNVKESYKGPALSLTPTQPTRTTSPEITLVPNKSSDKQSRIDSLSPEDKALFNKFAVKHLEDKDDVVNRMTRAVVDHYREIFPDLYNIYSTLFRKNSTAPNIENASQRPVSEQESPISAPYAVANPSTGIPITRDDIKHVITELAIEPWGDDAVVQWDLDEIADTILLASSKYQVDPILALAQGTAESHWGANPDAKLSRDTKNIFNVLNTDDGGKNYYPSYADSIEAYMKLMRDEYNWGNEDSWVTAKMMIDNDFYRPSRQGRYASDPNYTNVVRTLVNRIYKTLDEKNSYQRMVLVPNSAQSEDERSVPATPADTPSSPASPASLVKAAVENKASQFTKPQGRLETGDGWFTGRSPWAR